MIESDDNPYAAPDIPADAKPSRPPELPILNRIVSTALFTFATLMLICSGGGTLVHILAPSLLPPDDHTVASTMAVCVIVIGGLYAIGFWLRRHKKPSE
ncbi:MAG: hypothetical protein AB7U73_17315 [Pirellulales bacterium]